jgi:hypothetical protein
MLVNANANYNDNEHQRQRMPTTANDNTSKRQHQQTPTPVNANADKRQMVGTMNVGDKRATNKHHQGWSRKDDGDGGGSDMAPSNGVTQLSLQTRDDGAIFFFCFLILFYFSSINNLSPLRASARRV